MFRFTCCFILLPITILSCSPREYRFEIPVEGRLQHVLDTGRGRPVVVFITGLGDDLSAFDSLQQEVSAITRTISYDRAGLGKSQSINKPRTVMEQTAELDMILSARHMTKDVILVGHSIGGHIARYYASQHPAKVSGLVLLDPAHELFWSGILSSRPAREQFQLDSILNALYATTSAGVQAEFRAWHTSDSILAVTPFVKGIPVTMITSAKYEGDEQEWPLNYSDKQLWIKLHNDLVVQAPWIKHVVTNQSGHYIHYDEPALALREIREMVLRIREAK
jgi:pimeloyl-ACP methyl ester carboxylesterase